jgi:hypothetical protein
MSRPEARYQVDLQVYLTWQDPQGMVRRAPGRCVDLSASGAHIKTIDPLAPQSSVILDSQRFGRIGHATVRYCRRAVMRYEVGLLFSTPLVLCDALRQEIVGRARLVSGRPAPESEEKVAPDSPASH